VGSERSLIACSYTLPSSKVNACTMWSFSTGVTDSQNRRAWEKWSL